MLPFEVREFRILFVQFLLCFGKLLTQEAGGTCGLLFSLTGILREKHGSNFGANLLCKLRCLKCRGDIESRQLMGSGALHGFHGLNRDGAAQSFHLVIDVRPTLVFGIKAQLFDNRLQT